MVDGCEICKKSVYVLHNCSSSGRFKYQLLPREYSIVCSQSMFYTPVLPLEDSSTNSYRENVINLLLDGDVTLIASDLSAAAQAACHVVADMTPC
nr:PREDICTED: uncharacterized protein LOC108951419 isoform X2 [Musa acuminata subsp. malaccensis]XP_018674536.1 PREDICTED: uncharacterized protein LOC108951419 isoform X2 [Musa acuminata subsp. malaccensis]